jgi:hypothetical protein
MKITATAFLLLSLASGLPARGQSGAPAPDPAASVALLTGQYTASFPAYPQLANGPEYADYAKRYAVAAGHQFFIWPEWQHSRVVYNERLFTDLTLTYDIVLDQLVVLPSDLPTPFRLPSERVREFTIGEHHFLRLTPDSLTNPALRPGFYELLADGPATLLARRVKKLHERTRGTRQAIDFLPADQLFIRKAGSYYLADSKSALTRVFADRGPQIQQYIKTNRLTFSQNRFSADILQLTRYYNSLATQ